MSEDEEVLKVLKAAGLDILSCMHCGTCTGSCPSGRHTGLNTRRILRDARKNRPVLEDKDLWLCTTCYTCQERCPQGIEITDIIFGLKNMAFKKKITPPGYLSARKSLYDAGKLYEPTEWEREDLKLDDVPELNVEDTRKVLDKMGLMKLEEDE